MHSRKLKNEYCATWAAVIFLAMGSMTAWGQANRPGAGAVGPAGAGAVGPGSTTVGPGGKPGTGLGASGKAVWVNLPDTAMPDKNAAGAKVTPPSKGSFMAIGVDPTNGEVYAVLTKNQGLFKSTDQGETFKELTGSMNCPGGMYWPGSVNINPAGKGAIFFGVGGPGALTLDSGATWTNFKPELAPKGFDDGCVAWENDPKAILAMNHDQGKVLLSVDLGKTWIDLGAKFNTFGPIGIFDDKTIVARKHPGELERTTDQGATWAKAADLSSYKIKNQVIVVFKGVGYLATDKGLLVSKDKGATWSIQGAAVNCDVGPFFADEKRIAVIGPEGCYETTDGGAIWATVALPPPGANKTNVNASYTWDPGHDIFYFVQANHPAMKCVIAPAGGVPTPPAKPAMKATP